MHGLRPVHDADLKIQYRVVQSTPATIFWAKNEFSHQFDTSPAAARLTQINAPPPPEALPNGSRDFPSGPFWARWKPWRACSCSASARRMFFRCCCFTRPTYKSSGNAMKSARILGFGRGEPRGPL